MTLAAILGWAAVAWNMGMFGFTLELAIVSAIIGLPIAFLGVFFIGGPILWRAMARRISALRAIMFGAGIALALQILSICVGRVYAFLVWRGPNFSQVGGSAYTISIDGVLTIYGWSLVAIQTLQFMALGAGIALMLKGVVSARRALFVKNSK